MSRFAVVGYGHIGRVHAKAINELEEATLAAIVESDQKLWDEIRETYPKVKVYGSVSEACSDGGIDAVSICLPTYLHRGAAIEAANSGRHVLVEKPIALNLREADEMIEACEKNGVRLGVIYQRRFELVFRELKAAIDKGLFGIPVMAEVSKKWYRSAEYFQWDDWRGKKERAGGRAVFSSGIHQLDLLRWFMGQPASLYGYVDTRVHDVDVDDVGFAVVRFESGAVASVEFSAATYSPQYERLEVHGSTGSVVVVGREISEWKLRDDPRTAQDFSVKNARLDDPNVEHPLHDAASNMLRVPGLLDVIKGNILDFVAAIKEGREPLINGREARKSLEMATAIYRSSESGLPVKFPLDS